MDEKIIEVFSFLIQDAYNTAKEKGWHELEVTVPHSLMMIVDEITELLHEYRKGSSQEIVYKEMADVFIRLFDFMGNQGYDDIRFCQCLIEKMRQNKERPYRHGNKPF